MLVTFYCPGSHQIRLYVIVVKVIGPARADERGLVRSLVTRWFSTCENLNEKRTVKEIRQAFSGTKVFFFLSYCIRKNSIGMRRPEEAEESGQ